VSRASDNDTMDHGPWTMGHGGQNGQYYESILLPDRISTFANPMRIERSRHIDNFFLVGVILRGSRQGKIGINDNFTHASLLAPPSA
jgi:hypothetical protein